MSEKPNQEMFKFMDNCLKYGKEELEDTGQIAVVAYVRPSEEGDFDKEFGHDRKDGKKPMATMPYEATSGDKDDWYNMIGRFVQRFGAEFSVMVAESWYVETNEEDYESDREIAPGEHPNRKEAIVIMGIKYDKTGFITGQYTIMQPFERKSDGIKYSNIKRLDNSNAEGDSKLADVTARQDLL